MSKEGMPLQVDMFTGHLVDTRNSYRRKLDHEQELPQQLSMFSTRGTVKFGETLRPWLKQTPTPPMVLIREDPRTPEEQEADLQREAQKLTIGLFPTEVAPAVAIPEVPTPVTAQASEKALLADIPSPATESNPQADEDEGDEPPALAALSPYAAYLELIQVAEEQAATLSATSVVELAAIISLNLAKLDSRHAGLTDAEITTALRIGAFRGRTQRQASSASSPDLEQVPSLSDAHEYPSPMPQVAEMMQIAITAIFAAKKTAKKMSTHLVPDDPLAFSLSMVQKWMHKLKRDGEYSFVTSQALRFWLEQAGRLMERDIPTLPYPVLSLTKAELMNLHPDCAERIAALDGGAMRQLANFVSEALRQPYLTAVGLALD